MSFTGKLGEILHQKSLFLARGTTVIEASVVNGYRQTVKPDHASDEQDSQRSRNNCYDSFFLHISFLLLIGT
jgi:hypothetical protein